MQNTSLIPKWMEHSVKVPRQLATLLQVLVGRQTDYSSTASEKNGSHG